MLLLLLLVLPFLANGQTCKFCAAGDVTVDITTGAYKDILVVVDKDVSYDTQIIQNIKVLEQIKAALQLLQKGNNC